MKTLMSRSIAAALVSALVLATRAGMAGACTCGWVPLEKEIAETPFIFTGVVLSVTETTPYYTDWSLEVEIVPTACWKGALPDTALLYTNPGGSSVCGVTFAVGEEWLVFGYEVAGKLITSTCNTTHVPYAGDPVLDALGPPKSVQTLSASWGRVKAVYR